LFYNLLFRAVSEALLEIAADPRHLGARIGVLAVLHTWSQNLRHHPHLHCLVPAGGLAFDNSRWVATRRGFFLPVRVLSRMFRGKLLAFLKQGYRGRQLCFPGRLAELSSPRAFHSLLHTLRRREWVTEPQKSALSRSCPQCKCGTLHVVPRHFAVELGSPNLTHACTHFNSS
jgi:Putative transposase